MLKIQPVSETEAAGDVKSVYQSIKKTLDLDSVPLIFQYLATFPVYLTFLWKQTEPNFTDPEFKKQVGRITQFADIALTQIYVPSSDLQSLLINIDNPNQLKSFSRQSVGMNASLYLMCLSIRESLKGKYLGIKQIGTHLTYEEQVHFSDVSEGFSPPPPEQYQTLEKIRGTHLSVKKSELAPFGRYQDFFNSIQKEVEALEKKEAYLTRRVELERFSLAQLPLMPHPLDSSFVSVTKSAANHPLFPELIYLISDLFPTQAARKLLTATVMECALNYRPRTNTRSTEVSVV